MKERYERARLSVTLFDHDDVILTSGEPLLFFSRDVYEGYVFNSDS